MFVSPLSFLMTTEFFKRNAGEIIYEFLKLWFKPSLTGTTNYGKSILHIGNRRITYQSRNKGRSTKSFLPAFSRKLLSCSQREVLIFIRFKIPSSFGTIWPQIHMTRAIRLHQPYSTFFLSDRKVTFATSSTPQHTYEKIQKRLNLIVI